MSRETPPHGESDGKPPAGDEADATGEAGAKDEADAKSEANGKQGGWSETVLNFVVSLQGAFAALLVVSVVTPVVLVVLNGTDPSAYLDSSSDLLAAGLIGILSGVGLTGVLLERSKKKSRRSHQQKIGAIEQRIDRLATVTSIGDEPSATYNKLDRLISAAKNGELGNDSTEHRDTGPDGNPQPTHHSISAVLKQMVAHRLPPEETPARALIDQIQTYEPGDRGALKDAVEELKDQAEDVQLLEETLASANKGVSVSRDPSEQEFTTSLDALDATYKSLDTSPGDRAPALARERTKNFVKSHITTVKNFQSYFDRQQTDDSAIDLQAASQIEADSTVNLVPGSTAKYLIDDLQNREDGDRVKRRLRQAIDEMNSYRSVRSSLDTEEELRRELDTLSESANNLRGPVADILQQKVDDVEQLFASTSLEQMDDIHRIALQERISVLTDIVAELNQIGRYQDGALSEELESLDREINNFISRYIDSQEWNHYNHSISNQYVSLAQEFHEDASEAAGRNETRARAFVEAGQRTLKLTEQLYQKPKFTSLLDPTID